MEEGSGNQKETQGAGRKGLRPQTGGACRKEGDAEVIFLEAKWFYNWMVADIKERLNAETEKAKVVEIKVEDHFEERELLFCLKYLEI